MLARLEQVRVPRGAPLVFVILLSVVMFLLAVEAVTGVLLALYYRPSLAGANDSVRFIVSEAAFGDLIRALHAIASHALVATLGITGIYTLARRAYKSPNGVAWASGALLLILVILEAFTGTLLPWTRQSVVESQISANLVGRLPLIGHWLHRVLMGGDRAGDLALVRIPRRPRWRAPDVLHRARRAPHPARRRLRPQGRPAAPPAHAARHRARHPGVGAHLDGAGGAHGGPPARPRRVGGHLARERVGGAASLVPPRHARGLASRPRPDDRRPRGDRHGLAVGLFAALVVFGPALDRRGSRFGQVVGFVVLAAIAGGTLHAIFSVNPSLAD